MAGVRSSVGRIVHKVIRDPHFLSLPAHDSQYLASSSWSKMSEIHCHGIPAYKKQGRDEESKRPLLFFFFF